LKETEIGLLPAEWEIVKLDQVADINLGQSPPSSTYNTTGDGLPFLQGKTTFGRVFPTPERWCSAPKRIAKPGSVLISVRAPVGDVNIAQDEYCIGRGLTSLDGKPSLDNWFLFYLLIFSKSRLESKSTGSTFKSINKGILKSFSMPLPSLPEQRRIAGALRAIQEAIAAQEDVIAAARELKRSLMERLFTYGTDVEPAPTKETEIGEIPEHWELKQLGSVASIGNGSTPKRSNSLYWDNGTIPWLTSGKIHEEIIQRADEFVTELALEECHLPLVPEGSVLVAITGQGKTLGNAALTKFDTCINQHLAYLHFETSEASPEFVLAFLQRQYQHLRGIGRAGGSTKMALTCGLLANYPLPLPKIEEQERIARTDAVLRNKIAAEEQRKAALEEVFRSALEQLMTGQIRLNAESQRRRDAENS
jgi:type I restriction enzyme S subunit